MCPPARPDTIGPAEPATPPFRAQAAAGRASLDGHRDQSERRARAGSKGEQRVVEIRGTQGYSYRKEYLQKVNDWITVTFVMVAE